MRTECARIAALSLAVAGIASAASAQYAGDPFFTSTVPESRAMGLEAIGNTLTLAETFTPPFADALVERFEAMTGTSWARFGGTLEEDDQVLADELREALGRVGDAAAAGGPTAEAAKAARGGLNRAYAAVVPAALRDAPEFKGALMADLLFAEGGISEGYEGAIDDVWEYPGGWAALQRFNALWSGVEGRASEVRRADGQEMLAALRALYPDPGPPESTTGWNPDEAEAPAQRMGGILEEVVNANLYPGRDLPRLAGHLAEVTAESCALYDAGKPEVAAEGIIAAYSLYAMHLADTVAVFDPDSKEHADKLFGSLVAVEDDDDEEVAGDAAASGGDPDDVPAVTEDDAPAGPQADGDEPAAAASDNGPAAADEDDEEAVATGADASAACHELSGALTTMQNMFGG